MTDCRTSYEQASSEYDPAFERALVAEITLAIGRASICTDANVMCLRTGEMTSALLTALALTLALSPESVRSPSAIRKLTTELGKRLRQRIAAARASTELHDFARHCFHGSDAGGHA